MDRQPGMGPCPGNPHLCRVSRALGLASLLLSICSPGAKSSEAHGSGVKGSEANNPVKGTQGGAVWFHMNTNPGAELEKILWGFFPQSAYVIMLEVHRGAEDAPTWCNLWDKYGQRVHVPNMTSLRIENLTSEDSGRYWAQAMLPGGGEMSQLFQLTVYEPVPLPQIVTESLSLTPDWCNVTLECRIMRDGENLSVTWESQGLLGGLERRPPPGPARSSWILAVSQPLSQPHASLTCVVSNPVDQKTVTKALGEVCAPGSHGPLSAIRGASVVLPFFLCVGVCIYMCCDEKEVAKGAESQRSLRTVMMPHAHKLSQQESQDCQDKCTGEHHLEEREHLTTVYHGSTAQASP